MRSACVVNTRFILNNFLVALDWGSRLPRPPWIRPCQGVIRYEFIVLKITVNSKPANQETLSFDSAKETITTNVGLVDGIREKLCRLQEHAVYGNQNAAPVLISRLIDNNNTVTTIALTIDYSSGSIHTITAYGITTTTRHRLHSRLYPRHSI